MEKKNIVKKILMAVGFIAAGIGGAVTFGEFPEQLEKFTKMAKDEETSEPTEEE